MVLVVLDSPAAPTSSVSSREVARSEEERKQDARDGIVRFEIGQRAGNERDQVSNEGRATVCTRLSLGSMFGCWQRASYLP